jgi:hypothetical protein
MPWGELPTLALLHGRSLLAADHHIPPHYMKSIMASVAFPAYVLGHNATKRVICASYSKILAC